MSRLLWMAASVVALILVVRTVARVVARLSGARYRAFRQVASRYRGVFEGRRLGEPPTVTLDHPSATIRIGMAPAVPGQVLPPRTRVVARFRRGLPVRLELQPYGRPASPQPPKGTRLVRLGLADFDRAFFVQANDPEMARAWLEPPRVRAAIEALRRLAPPAGMLVSINPERLLVQVDRPLGESYPMLESAVRETAALLEGLVRTVESRLAEGIQIVPDAPEPAGPAEAPVCEVCGDPILGEHVDCSRCRTPYHRDCWGFVGGCSTFGCPGKTCEAVAGPPA